MPYKDKLKRLEHQRIYQPKYREEKRKRLLLVCKRCGNNFTPKKYKSYIYCEECSKYRKLKINRESGARYRLKYQDKLNENARLHRLENPEETKRKDRENDIKYQVQRKKYREEHKEQIKEYNKKYHKKYYITHKKERSEYHKKHNAKPEIKEKNHQNYLKNREETLLKDKKNYQEHKTEINAKRREDYKKNEEKWKIYNEKRRERTNKLRKERRLKKGEEMNAKKRKRWKEDQNFQIAERLRCLVRNCFRKYTKTGKIMSSSKYGIDYKAIMESLKPFPEDISKYHIDHKICLASFNFVNSDGSTNLEEVKKAFAPENHQWLTAKENLRKIREDKKLSIHKRIN
mgnify:FL=1